MTILSRRQTLTGLGAALALPCVRPSWAQAGTVNIYNWADYIGETTIADFEAATGISAVYDTYSSAEELQAKTLAGSTGYDVVFTAGMMLTDAVNGLWLYRLARNTQRHSVRAMRRLALAIATRSILPLMFVGLPHLFGTWLMFSAPDLSVAGR
jgi:hypothetical protein